MPAASKNNGVMENGRLGLRIATVPVPPLRVYLGAVTPPRARLVNEVVTFVPTQELFSVALPEATITSSAPTRFDTDKMLNDAVDVPSYERLPVRITGNGLMVTVTWEIAGPQGEVCPVVVSVSVTEPETASADDGVYVALSVFVLGEKIPEPVEDQNPPVAPPPTEPLNPAVLLTA